MEEERAVTNGLSIVRTFETPEGLPIDITKLKRGEMIYVKLTITSLEERTIGDLVIEDLFAGAMEPINDIIYRVAQEEWVLRSDARDDRMLVFSKHVSLKAGEQIEFMYPMRVVSSGEFTLPGVSVEAMYFPKLNAKSSPSHIDIAE